MPPFELTLNGTRREVEADEASSLLEVLHEQLGTQGTPWGCGIGLCGACTVVVDDKAVRSCSTQVSEVAGRDVKTIEGIESDHPVLEAWRKAGLPLDCLCPSGRITTLYALWQRGFLTPDNLATVLENSLCDCGRDGDIQEALDPACTKE